MKYYRVVSSAFLCQREREREVRHECSGIGAFQASGAWESLGGLVPVCPQGEEAAQMGRDGNSASLSL